IRWTAESGGDADRKLQETCPHRRRCLLAQRAPKATARRETLLMRNLGPILALIRALPQRDSSRRPYKRWGSRRCRDRVVGGGKVCGEFVPSGSEKRQGRSVSRARARSLLVDAKAL